MSTIRLLAFDYGKKFIGVAVGNTTSGTAQGLTTLQGKNHSPDWDKIDQLFQEWRPDALVLGLPLNMDGTDTGITPQVRKFGDKLKDRYNRPVHMVDERLSSQTAKNRLTETGVSLKRSNKSKIDMLAAQTILQSFLDDHAGTELG
ncbi:MAG: Holliday junction resolvase RuvX [Gammaproteobacteria bacterium]|nr:Holliday junction resolvase RuvX [Gammaproteobacteria bacterium]